MEECRKPGFGSSCDIEFVGVSKYWCCHNPYPGCYSNSNDALAHCPSKKVKKVEEYNYCCQVDECCHFDDLECNIGATCCTDDCEDPKLCGYTKTGCSGQYGAIHNCAWSNTTDSCIAWLPEA